MASLISLSGTGRLPGTTSLTTMTPIVQGRRSGPSSAPNTLSGEHRKAHETWRFALSTWRASKFLSPSTITRLCALNRTWPSGTLSSLGTNEAREAASKQVVTCLGSQPKDHPTSSKSTDLLPIFWTTISDRQTRRLPAQLGCAKRRQAAPRRGACLTSLFPNEAKPVYLLRAGRIRLREVEAQ